MEQSLFLWAQDLLCRTYTDTALRENSVVTEGPCCTSFSLPNCCTETLAKPFFLRKQIAKYYLPALNQHCWEKMLSVTGHTSPPAILANRIMMCPLPAANNIQHLELGLIPLGMKSQSSQLLHRVMGALTTRTGLWGWHRTADNEMLLFFLHPLLCRFKFKSLLLYSDILKGYAFTEDPNYK